MKYLLNQVSFVWNTSFKLLKLLRTFLLRKFIEMYQKGPYKTIPMPIQNGLRFIWKRYYYYLKPTIYFLLSLAKRVSSKPIMRAMSTVDHKRIRVMYLMFRLCARITRV